MDNTAETPVSRRTVLKSSGTAITISSINILNTTSTEARQSTYHLGRGDFIEFKIEHNVPENIPKSVSCGRPSYITDNENEIVGLLQPNPSLNVSGDLLISNNNQLHTNGFEPRKSQDLLTDWSFQGGSIEYAELEQSYQPPTPTFSIIDSHQGQETNPDSTLKISIDNKQFAINTGETKVVRLSNQEVRIRKKLDKMRTVRHESRNGDGEYVREKNVYSDEMVIEVTPIMKVSYHGPMDIHGETGKSIIPMNSDNNYARSITSAAKENNRNINKSDDLLIISHGGE